LIGDKQTGAPAFGYPAKDQQELAAECRRLKSMLVPDERPLPEISSSAHVAARRMPNAAGDRQKASEYYGKLVNLAKNADTERPETQEAKAFLAGKQ